jgi:hypothetical protein
MNSLLMPVNEIVFGVHCYSYNNFRHFQIKKENITSESLKVV